MGGKKKSSLKDLKTLLSTA